MDNIILYLNVERMFKKDDIEGLKIIIQKNNICSKPYNIYKKNLLEYIISHIFLNYRKYKSLLDLIQEKLNSYSVNISNNNFVKSTLIFMNQKIEMKNILKKGKKREGIKEVREANKGVSGEAKEEAERKRKEAERKRKANEEERQRKAKNLKKASEESEKKRLAEEVEKKRLAEEAERKKLQTA